MIAYYDRTPSCFGQFNWVIESRRSFVILKMQHRIHWRAAFSQHAKSRLGIQILAISRSAQSVVSQTPIGSFQASHSVATRHVEKIRPLKKHQQLIDVACIRLLSTSKRWLTDCGHTINQTRQVSMATSKTFLVPKHGQSPIAKHEQEDA